MRVDNRRLLDEHPSPLPAERDSRPERCRLSLCRGRRNERRAQIEELVRLNNDRVASPALLVPAHVTRRRKVEDLAPDHLVARRWGKFGQLLADHAHLLAIAFVGRDASDFFAKCRPGSPASRSLAQRGAHCFGIGHTAGADEVERCDRSIIETNVNGAGHVFTVARNVLQH